MKSARPHPARTHRVTLIPGDGIGPEVTDAAVQVVAATGVEILWDRQLAGAAAVEAGGDPIPSVNVALRKTFDLFANVRPIRNLPGVRSAFKNVDLVGVRENTEDLYAGIEHTIAPGVVESVKVITAKASRRIARFAFDYATREKRHKVTAIHMHASAPAVTVALKCRRGG